MNTPDNVTFGIASEKEVALMVEWAAREGWNPGLSDIGAFRAADPDGFRIARIDGEPVASISLVRYGSDFAFLGFYIAQPDMRGKGIGYALWQDALTACNALTIGLDGVVDQQNNYRKSGFELAHRNIRYGGVPRDMGSDRSGLATVTAGTFRAVTHYDRRFFPAGRENFLTEWLGAPGHTVLAATDGDALTAYGVIRPCREGHKIGPLFADTSEIAERVFDALVAETSEGPVFMDPPEPNTTACQLAESRGLTPVFETARMYRGPSPDLPLDRIFGITTFELG